MPRGTVETRQLRRRKGGREDWGGGRDRKGERGGESEHSKTDFSEVYSPTSQSTGARVRNSDALNV